ncbi:MAG: DNA helicase UvrD, partial [Actinomycetales bacterium]
ADPNQAIFRFRGAGNSPLKWFIDRFGNKNLQLLSTNYRGGEQLVKSWRRLASYIPAASQTGVNWQHSKSAFPGGEVRVVIYDDPEAEISHLAQQLRHAHLRDGIPWRECAVITRTARAELMPIARSLRQSGIPVEMAGDEIVLAKQLAVRPLLLALQVAESETIDPDQAHRLLTSPLAGLDAVKLREIGRQLRASQKIQAELPKPSAQLLADWLQNPQLADLTDGEPIIKLAELLGQVRELIAQDASVHQMLWQLWSGTDWPGQLQESALAGDLQANADLDAVCELFEVAAAGQHLRGRSGILAFLTDISGQMIAADTARESDLRGRGVQLMTAHRAKGEQFRQVYILGAREGNWPKLIRRGSLLEPEMLSADGIGPVDITSQLPAERRLFYVACSRATEKLVVSGTHGMEGEGERPSRFLAELGVEIEQVTGRANRPLTLTGLTTDLRAVSVDPTAEPGLRKAAAARLAKLAQAKDRR